MIVIETTLQNHNDISRCHRELVTRVASCDQQDYEVLEDIVMWQNDLLKQLSHDKEEANRIISKSIWMN